MKVIAAFDSFKGCLTALEACNAAAAGWQRRYPHAEVVCLPLSDGGEGMVASIAQATAVQWVEVQVHGPLMEPLTVRYAVSADGQTAYLEMAMAAGLTLVPEAKRNPEQTTTYGVGELLLDAAHRGCREVVMGIGGSATCDGGEGMVRCLLPYLPLPLHVTVASDVTNPLYGPSGAAYVFAPQKGATPEQVERLDGRLRQWEKQTIAQGFDKRNLAQHPGAGAAGGLGYALMAYLDAEMHSGIDLILDAIDFDSHLDGADYVLTGEGHSDQQTLMGKVPMGVLQRAKAHGVPVKLLSGGVSDTDALFKAGFAEVVSINRFDRRPLDVLMRREVAALNLAHTALLTAARLQRITLDGGFTCPNRDGQVGEGGCTFCLPEAFAPDFCRTAGSITAQLAAGKQFFAHKNKGEVSYLAYFQSYSATYAPVEVLRQRYAEALADPDVVGLVLGTRPDCLSDEVLDLLSELHQQHPIFIEIGVESCHDATLHRINRGHDFACAADAIRRCADRGLPVGVHLILGLPGESEEDMLRSAELLQPLPISSVKLHQLQILRGTPLAAQWQEHPEDFVQLTAAIYARLAASFMRRLGPGVHLERVAASAPSALLLAPRWGLRPAHVEAMVHQALNGCLQSELL